MGAGWTRGHTVGLGAAITATIVAVEPDGTRQVHFSTPIRPYLDDLGEVPLPPYITQYTGDRERYQTVYSRTDGSVAAPTAGLHFTPELLIALRSQGVQFDTATLHVGLDTFKPVASARVEDHIIHTEWATLTAATARRINETTLAGGRIVAVGHHQRPDAGVGCNGRPGHRSLCPGRPVPGSGWQPFAGNVSLFIYPGYRFRAVDALITNFHLPRSSLLMLVSAFVGQAQPDDLDAGRRLLLDAYAVAKQEGYRFFSFGDAMLIL